MKMIQNTIMACLLLVVAACSETDSVETTDQNLVETKIRASQEIDEQIFVQEIMFMSLINDLQEYLENPNEYGEQIEQTEYYLEYLRLEMDAFSGLPGKGCPKPQPCDVIGNCKSFKYPGQLDRLHHYGELTYELEILNLDYEPVNAIAERATSKCPKPVQVVFDNYLETGLEGDGIFKLEAYFEPAGQVLTFEAYYQELN